MEIEKQSEKVIGAVLFLWFWKENNQIVLDVLVAVIADRKRENAARQKIPRRKKKSSRIKR